MINIIEKNKEENLINKKLNCGQKKKQEINHYLIYLIVNL